MSRARESAARTWADVRLTAARAAGEMIRDSGHRTAAQMAFFLVLALIPLVLLAVAGFSFLAGDQVKGDVVDALLDIVPLPEDAARRQLQSVLDSVASQARLSVLSVAVLIAAASSLMAGARYAVTEAWDLDRRRPLVRRKLLDVVLVPVLALVLLGGLAADGLNEAVDSGSMSRDAALADVVFAVVSFVADAMPFVTSFLAFVILYRLLPIEGSALRRIWPGALVATVALALGRGGLELYFEQLAGYEALYGALSGVIALLIYVYLGTLVFVYGAEFSAEWSRLEQGGRARDQGFIEAIREHADPHGQAARERGEGTDPQE